MYPVERPCNPAILWAKGQRIQVDAPFGTLTRVARNQLTQLFDALYAGQATIRIRPKDYNGDVWLAPTEEAAHDLRIKVIEGGEEAPVLTFEEAALLHGAALAMRNAVLDAKAVFPGCRFEVHSLERTEAVAS